MRIGISGYVGNKKTGIGRVIENILMSVSPLMPDSEFILFVNKDFTEFIDNRWPPNVKVVPFNVSKNNPVGNILWHQFGYQRLLSKYRCDISLIPNFSLLLWKNRPTIVIIHDTIEFNVSNKFGALRMMYRKRAVPLMGKKADKVITVSHSSYNDIIKYCNIPGQKIDVIHNGYNRMLFKEYDAQDVDLILRKYSLNKGSYILNVGTVDHPGKNLYSVLRAYFDLKKEHGIEETLVVVGKRGHNYEYLEKMIQQSEFRNEVKLLGFVNDEDLPLLFAGAKVFCFLSFYEGFGLPVLEAMASGCPVITSNVSSLPEVIGDAGLTVNPNDTTALKRALLEIITSSDVRETLRKKGMKRASQFSWEKAADAYANIIAQFGQKQKIN